MTMTTLSAYDRTAGFRLDGDQGVLCRMRALTHAYVCVHVSEYARTHALEGECVCFVCECVRARM